MSKLIALLVALSVAGAGAVALPVAADAAPAKAKKCSKGAAKKKKCKRPKKRPAPQAQQPGPQGPAGPAGPAGQPGSPGTTIVARARLAAPMTITGDDMVKVPMTGATWTQQADETDDFVGEATMKLPAECTASGPGPTDNPMWWAEDQAFGTEYFGGAWGDIKLGKEFIGYVDFPVFPEEGGRTVTSSFHMQRKLMEPETATPRELTIEFGKYCEGAGQDFQLESVKVNVIGVR